MCAHNNSSRLKILTDVPEHRVQSLWNDAVEFRNEIVGLMGICSDLKAAFNLIRYQKNYDLIVLNGNRSGSIFLLISGLLRLSCPTIVVIDCLWYEKNNTLLRFIKKIQMQLMSWPVDCFVVWASHEVKDYAKAFEISEGKFYFLHHHHTLEGYQYEVEEGDYIFSGGDGDRDYPTLLKAIENIDCKVKIATRLPDWNGNIPIPPNVQAFPATHMEFRTLMANAKIVVLPMKKGLLHSGGQQTFLNAMAMGKPVIVADDKGACDYIQDGETGFVVPSGDFKGMRGKIKILLGDDTFSGNIGNNARLKAQTEYSTKKCMEDILSLSSGLVSKRR